MRLTNPEWQHYSPVHREAKLCYHNCTKGSELPLRKVLRGAPEPNYETMTYNCNSKCNQPSVRAAVKYGLSHIFFTTRYFGKKRLYEGRRFIVGYFEIGWTATRGRRIAIRAKKISFVRIEDAYEFTPERLRKISPNVKKLKSLSQLTQRVSGPLFEEILGHLDKHDDTTNFLLETARLKAKTNPFQSVPSGRIFIINVGANTEHRQWSPLFDDDTFEFVPIPASSDDGYTFGDLRQFYAPDTPLTDRFSSLNISPATKVHNDPEFATFTYGDSPIVKPGLRPMTKGDFLFFLVRLVPYRNQGYVTDEAIFALIGYLEIDEQIPLPSDDAVDRLLTSPAFNRNAHVIRWLNNRVPDDEGYAVYKGSTNSRRFHTAVKFDREFVEDIPLLTADGDPWNWDTSTQIGRIGSYTRTARLHIDPSTEPARAERFWIHIWESQ